MPCLQYKPATWDGGIFGSPDICKNGNGGIRGLTHEQCLTVCMNIPTCQVSVFFRSWWVIICKNESSVSTQCRLHAMCTDRHA